MKKIKIGRLQINFSNKWLYTFIVIGVIFLLGICVYAVDKTQAWHSADQIEGLESGIASGFCIFSRTQSGCPEGWTRDSGFDSRTIRGASSPGGTGGSDSHSHGLSAGYTKFGSGGYYKYKSVARWAANQALCTVCGKSTSYSPDKALELGGTTDSKSSWPPYMNVIVCCKD